MPQRKRKRRRDPQGQPEHAKLEHQRPRKLTALDAIVDHVPAVKLEHQRPRPLERR